MFRRACVWPLRGAQAWAFAALLVGMASACVVGSKSASGQRSATFEAYLTERSYGPGDSAVLRVRNGSSRLTIQIFRAGAERGRTRGDSTLRGVPVEQSRSVHLVGGRNWGTVRIRLQYWPSGLYYVRVRSRSGRVYFAPFVLRGAGNLRGRIAVVMRRGRTSRPRRDPS